LFYLRNEMIKDELIERTKKFAISIIKLVGQLPDTITGRTISNQIIRFGTSVAANYRSACRARSSSGFISEITKVEKDLIRNSPFEIRNHNNINFK